ncbi:hypothetical protein KL918_002367 [Ogataea parapolymorpha]|uniref:Uncharacterized protein n=1 Tax=Ogataea parapolymorpha (strain ATCC 26012 / BCRC 20466 / JCM 22074 / NRRL Y-7560 / DL-1) TaxID=871575 RepID=W1QJI5_OGAPD|nr:hypothetical protein HPODL_02174 [Ogataea parapolymorpha DL-1]ESX02858.1 hypothetical protein HPODL_02174 [Ogataea parapolymorpha DL-1]KAG7867770.1 hypothetical protein KL918_002367 [Ogataea parapolymorpha]KAG7870423.1 hypothetical protein KL916_005040 [Ogataea parapolymorpha]
MENQANHIDATTIARLFHTVAFDDKSIKISHKTLLLVSEYIKLFTSEAIVRSNVERLEEGKRDKERYRVDVDEHLDEKQQDAVLDTRHLEAVAGLLTLDF